MWQVPSLSIAAQAFLFSAAFASDTPRYARVIVLLLGIAAVLAALQLLAKHRYLESLHGQVESLCLGKLGWPQLYREELHKLLETDHRGRIPARPDRRLMGAVLPLDSKACCCGRVRHTRGKGQIRPIAPDDKRESATGLGAHYRFEACRFGFAASVTSEAEEKVPTGGELTLFSRCRRGRPDWLSLCRSSPVGDVLA